MKMQAALLDSADSPLNLREVDIDSPKGREILVKVRGSGLCHSDLFVWQNKSTFPIPRLLGHEVAGEVVELGSDVRNIERGDHVVACEVRHCGRCVDCARGRTWRCRHPEDTLRGADEAPRVSVDGTPVIPHSEIGGFAEYVLVHENQVGRVPKQLPWELASVLGCGVATGAGTSIHAAGVRVGDTVAVLGCGGVGLSAVWGAAFAGATRVIAVDVLDEKLELAKVFGATDVVNSANEDPIEAVRRLTDGVGVDYAIEAAGLKSTTLQAIDMTRPTGTAFLIGIQSPDNRLEFSPLFDLLLAKKSIRSVYMGSTNVARDFPFFAEMYRQGRFPLDRLVSKIIELADVEETFKAMESGHGARNVILFD